MNNETLPRLEAQGSTAAAAADRLYRLLGDAVRLFMAGLLGVMSVLIIYQIVARYVFNAPSALSEELLRYALIWLGILGAGYCFMTDRHLNLPLLIDALGEAAADRLRAINVVVAFGFGGLLVWGGVYAVSANASIMTPMLRVAVGSLQGILVVAGILICLSQLASAGRLLKHRRNRRSLVAAVGIVASVIALIGLARSTAIYTSLVDDHLEAFSTALLFASLSLFLIIGTPIAVGLALAGIVTLSLQIDLDVLFSTSGEQIFNGLNSFGFLALPFFILAGNIMNQAGIAQRLIDFAMLLGRRIPGSLWQTNVLANMLFGAISGSGAAAATAIGGIITPAAKAQKYDLPFTTAVNAASAPCGLLIPPSGALIVYSLLTGGTASVVALFLAGYLPGIIMGVSVMIVAYFEARRRRYPTDKTPVLGSEALRVFLRALPSLLLIAVVIGGIVGGVFTATEGSGVAVLYSLVLALIYRGLTLRSAMAVLVDTAVTSGIILFLIACSNLMSWSMTFASIPDTIGMILTSISDNKLVILLMINIALLIVGTFMDMAPAQLIFTPILFPIVTDLGVDPVHFGIIMVYNLSMGLVTPPVGAILFISCSISGAKITEVVRPLLPIFLMQTIGLLLITYVPALSLAIPRLFGV